MALATLVAALIMHARQLDPLPDGLQAQYFQNADWRGDAARSSPASVPSTDRVLADAAGLPAQTLSASWTGWIVAPSTGAYTFATSSNGGSWVYLDGQLVVDNGGDHPSRSKAGPTLALERGVHPLFVKYAETDGRVELRLLWQRGGGRFEVVPAWALRPHRIGYARFAVNRVVDIASRKGWPVWIVAIIAAAVFAFGPELRALEARAASATARLQREGALRPLVTILAASTIVNAVGLCWGLPRGAWVGDELTTRDVATAWSLHFANGWNHRYPPLHYYALTLAYLPVVGVRQLFGLEPSLADLLLMIAGRLLTLAMAAATLVILFFCGRRVFGSRAALFGAAMYALLTPFIYYAKTANVDVPYVMWFALALYFYLSVLERGSATDYVLWALTGTLAVCTKDQAYGLFAAMPLVVFYQRGRGAFDRRLAVASATAIVAFVLIYNLPVNAAGFAAHIRTLVGASGGYRAYEPTWSGRLALLDVTIRLVGRSWGWPMFLVAVIGAALALVSPTRRRIAMWLLLPVVSYYLTFINVVLYSYDRFLLPVCFVLALFGGYALDRFTLASSFRVWRRAAVAGMFAYTFLYSVTVDVLMLRDSRYAAEEWLRRHVDDEAVVAASSVITYMPRLDDFNSVAIFDPAALERIKPRFYVVNADYTFTEPPESPLGQVIAMVRSGDGPYRSVFTARSSNPWRWLPWGHPDLVGGRRDPEMVSFLRNISPTIEIYERITAQ